jgi:hypothetical protein
LISSFAVVVLKYFFAQAPEDGDTDENEEKEILIAGCGNSSCTYYIEDLDSFSSHTHTFASRIRSWS